MGFQFATCNREMALRHLQKAYPKRTLTDELVIRKRGGLNGNYYKKL